jgi:cytochrome c oxidase cbb3-type subunit 2
MKNGPAFFIGIFAAFTVSWGAIVLGTHAQLGALTPYFDENEGNSFPQRVSGVAAQGEHVYAELGCAACHTQQVRRPGFGVDQERGWGERQTVARDYIFQARPQLGAMRIGPDLANFGNHKPAPDAEELYKLLYNGSATHPSYRFLFEDREIAGERAANALNLGGDAAIPRDHEVIPTRRAEALVAYLQSRQVGFEYPEAHPAPAEGPAEGKGGHISPASKPEGKKGATEAPRANGPKTEPSPETEQSNPPGKRPEQAIPAAAPDENKKLQKK